MDKQIENLMALLGCDEETAKQIIADDKAIDKGEKLFELTAEQKANSKKYRQGDRKPTVYKFDKRERKADNDKRFLIDSIAWLLKTDIQGSDSFGDVGDNIQAENIQITNPERQIDFEYQGRKFRVVLSAPRSQEPTAKKYIGATVRIVYVYSTMMLAIRLTVFKNAFENLDVVKWNLKNSLLRREYNTLSASFASKRSEFKTLCTLHNFARKTLYNITTCNFL